jgi:hypothetical protein
MLRCENNLIITQKLCKVIKYIKIIEDYYIMNALDRHV